MKNLTAGLTRLVTVLVTVLFLQPAMAQPPTVFAQDNYLTFGMSYLDPGTERGVDYGIGFRAGYAGRLTRSSWWELTAALSVLESGSTTAIDFYQTSIGLDALFPIGSETRGHLYWLAGLGMAINDVKPDENDGSSFFANAGIGYRGSTWSNWGMRPRGDLRLVHDTVGEGTTDMMLMFTLEVPPKRLKVVEKIVEVERIVEVPVEVEKIVERESVCVVPTAPVEAAPAAPVDTDADGDGVPDGKDRCPQTLKGAKVDENGCVIKAEQKISLPNIEFESGKTVLAAGGRDKLESVVSFLQNEKDVSVDIFGHTDAQGADSYNQTLSEGRAKSVLEYLVSRGISASRMTSKGFGETQPIASNETADGRAENRRVELLIRAR